MLLRNADWRMGIKKIRHYILTDCGINKFCTSASLPSGVYSLCLQICGLSKA